jgi:hypothetical protein
LLQLISSQEIKCQGTNRLYHDTAPSWRPLCGRKGDQLLSSGSSARREEGAAPKTFPSTSRQHTTRTMSP